MQDIRFYAPMMHRVWWPWRALIIAIGLLAATHASARAQSAVDSLIPRNATNCSISSPPTSAGVVVSPGGFVIVFPRNDALTEAYTGCKHLWIADTGRTPRLATLYFEQGQLRRALAHDVRDPAGAVEGACSFPEGRSLLPTVGRRFDDAACGGVVEEPLYGLRVPTFPRSCMTTPDAPVCRDPH
ncbi:MAG: hypothetical protein U0132_04290 [Gemmatimonadaceae bacterium]